MTLSIARLLALLGTIALMLIAASAAFAQGDKPTSPESPNATITLPASGITGTSANALSITNNGTGRAGYFYLSRSSSTNPALEGRSNSSAAGAAGLLGQVMPAAGGIGAAGVRGINNSTNANGYGIWGSHKGAGVGVYGSAAGADGIGIQGNSSASSGTGKGVLGQTSSPSGYGGYFVNSSTGSNLNVGPGVGVYGSSTAGYGYGVVGRATAYAGTGVYGSSTGATGIGVQGSAVYIGVWAAANEIGVYSTGSTAIMAYGRSIGVRANSTADGSVGVEASASGTGSTGVFGTGSAVGVWGSSSADGSYGVEGFSTASGSTGVYGTGAAIGVSGTSTAANSKGVYGEGVTGVSGKGSAVGVGGNGVTGVYGAGSTTGTVGESKVYGIFGRALDPSGYAGYFEGRVYIHGTIYGAAQLTTSTDNPADSNKLIQQAAVVSPQQSGQINGNVVLDANGKAKVSLPGWFGGLYGDLRYQLTPIGDAAVLYIADEAKDGQFSIAGGKPGMKVSWQVSGVRQDKQALDNPLKVEVKRSDVEPKAPELVTPPAPAASDK